MKTLLLILVLSVPAFISPKTSGPETVRRVVKLMGSRFEFTAVHEDARHAEKAVNAAIAEVRRIEALISSWDPNSQTSAVNRLAGEEAVAVDRELYALIHRSIKVSRLTDGAFDISFASADRIWKFDGSMTTLPDPGDVAASVERIGFGKIILGNEGRTVMLKEKGMKIGFGAIGKGYAANRAKAVMQEMGIASGLVNAGGDLIAWGNTGSGGDWKVGIADPQNREKVLAWLWVRDVAVVTSGDYERYTELEGRRFAHIIDPRTGWPVEGLRSVTVVCPDAELADALATAIFVMGVEKGLALADRLKNVECVIVDDENRLHVSKNLPLNYYSTQDTAATDLYMKIGGEKDE